MVRFQKLSTEQLFLRFHRNGDAAALGEVFDRTAEDLFKLALYLGPQASDAEDLVQATYLTAIEIAGQFDFDRSLRPWLLGILSNHARRVRQQQVRRGDIAVDRLAPSGVDGFNPEACAQRAELQDTLDRSIARLAQPYRQILTLHLGHGLNAKQIGEVLERPAGTVRSQVVRGLERLRRLLPAGLTGSAAVLLAPGHVLAGVRVEVLHAAEISVVAASGAATSGAAISGALLSLTAGTRIGLLAVALFATGIWFVAQALTAEVSADDGAEPVLTARLASTGSGEAERAAGTTAFGTDGRSLSRERVLESKADDLADHSFLTVQLEIDGAPAPAGVLIEILPAIRPGTEPLFMMQMERPRRFARSDSAGRVHFADVLPGRARLLLSGVLLHQTHVNLRAGRQHRVAFAIPPVHPCEGRVFAPDGKPIENAAIWISDSVREMSIGAVAARSSATGEFHVRVPTKGMQVWAVHADYGPSLVVGFHRGEDVELRLGQRPGQLTCRVRDGKGAPLSGAVVQFAPSSLDSKSLPPSFATTDSMGEVHFTSLPEGAAMLVARKLGFATTTATAPKNRDGGGDRPRARIDLDLLAGAMVSGVVRRADGSPRVRLGVLAEVTDAGAGSHDAMLRRVATYTDRNGRFELRDLPSGRVRVRVVNRLGTNWLAQRRFDLRPGANIEWNPADDAVQHIRGRVVDPSGAALAGYRVTAVPAGRGSRIQRFRRRSTATDATGTFDLRRIEPSTDYDLFVHAPTGPTVMATALHLDAGHRGSVKKLELVVDPEIDLNEQGFEIVLRDLVDDVVQEMQVIARRLPSREKAGFPQSGGQVRLGLPPGEYELSFAVAGHGLVVLPPMRVAVGEFQPLEHRLQATGRLELDVTGATDRPLAVEIRDSNGTLVEDSHDEAGSWARAVLPLAPGRFEIAIRQAGAAPIRETVTVRPDAVLPLRRAMRAGRAVALRFPFDPLDNTFNGLGDLFVELRNSAGRLIDRRYLTTRSADSFTWKLALIVGDYKVEATSVWGGRVTKAFRVSEDTAATIEARLVSPN